MFGLVNNAAPAPLGVGQNHAALLAEVRRLRREVRFERRQGRILRDILATVVLPRLEAAEARLDQVPASFAPLELQIEELLGARGVGPGPAGAGAAPGAPGARGAPRGGRGRGGRGRGGRGQPGRGRPGRGRPGRDGDKPGRGGRGRRVRGG